MQTDLLDDEQAILSEIAERLRALRADRETQATFAARLGCTRQTYAKMERGDPKTPVGYWLRAATLFGMLDQWESLFEPPKSLFDLHQEQGAPRRRRARRK